MTGSHFLQQYAAPVRTTTELSSLAVSLPRSLLALAASGSVHEDVHTTCGVYLHADLSLKEKALALTTSRSQPFRAAHCRWNCTISIPASTSSAFGRSCTFTNSSWSGTLTSYRVPV